MTSNYIDSGYSYIDQSGGTSHAPGIDIYNVVNTPGVYKLNGNATVLANLLAIPCSLSYDTGVDDAYIVYPGFAIQLFQGGSFFAAGTASRSWIYCNYSNRPVLYSTMNNNNNPIFPTDWFNGSSSQTLQTQTGARYGANTSNSIRVWFRGTEVLSAYSSSACPDSITDPAVIRIFTGP